MTREDIEKVWLTDKAVCALGKDGRQACASYNSYPRLRHATVEQREKYILTHYGIHWEELDEDLSYEGLFTEQSTNRLYCIFIEHPELNASAIARRLGLSQSILAQYISGSKQPTKSQEAVIINEIHKIGTELRSIAE